jgi:hypothetical protein
LCAQIWQIHKNYSPLVFLYFDDTYKQHLREDEQLREIEFDDHCYEQIVNAFGQNSITPKLVVFRFVPTEGTLFLPQSLKLDDECKEEIEIRSLPLLLYDEMLPIV